MSAHENHPKRERRAFLARGGFHARSRFTRSTIPEEKWRQLVFNEAATTENSRKTSGTRVPFARLLNDFFGIVSFKRKSTK